jgi:hypothetical protein
MDARKYSQKVPFLPQTGKDMSIQKMKKKTATSTRPIKIKNSIEKNIIRA